MNQGRFASSPHNPDSRVTQLRAMLQQLEQSERLPQATLHAHQLMQFGELARHASAQSPFFRRRFDHAALDASQPWTRDRFARIPLLTREELMLQWEHIPCHALPPGHGAIHRMQSSGSTGQMVTVLRTDLTQLFWLALAMRDHLWHARDFSATLAIVKAFIPATDDPAQAARIGWGHPSTLLYKTGPGWSQPLSLDIDRQAEWLTRVQPHYLLTYPSNLAALLDLHESGAAKLPASLRHVRTVGETLHEGLRERCRALGDVDIVDMYSSQELGIIALQCPVSGKYHTQDENLIVEVLDDDGQPCQPGETGRLVITDLHNFATPLIRYETRDYAVAGSSCPCGRGLGTLERILGRRRNMVVLPDGSRHWPLVGAYRFREVADIRQYQVVQHSLTDLEVRLVTPDSITHEQETRLTELVHAAIGHPFPLRFSYFDQELPKTRGGKFEEFMSMVV